MEKLRELIDVVRGHKDVKSRLSVLTNPENLDTMTVLSKEEAHFLAVTNWLVKVPEWGDMFTPMNEFAQSLREPNISVGGRGRQDSIDFVRAFNEARAIKKLGDKIEKQYAKE